MPPGVGSGTLLFQRHANFVDLHVDLARVWLESCQAGNGSTGFLCSTLSVCESRALGEKQNPSSKNKCPEEGESVGDSPRGAVGVRFRSIADHLCGPDAQGDEQLVRSNEYSADQCWGALGLVPCCKSAHGMKVLR